MIYNLYITNGIYGVYIYIYIIYMYNGMYKWGYNQSMGIYLGQIGI